MKIKEYEIEAKLKFPCSYHAGYTFTVYAANKADAIKKARKEVGNMGHTRQDGPLSYKATEIDSQVADS